LIGILEQTYYLQFDMCTHRAVGSHNCGIIEHDVSLAFSCLFINMIQVTMW